MKNLKIFTTTALVTVFCLGISTMGAGHAAAQSTQPTPTVSSYCGGRLGSVSRLGEVRGYSVYTPITSTNSNPCIQIWDFVTGRTIGKVYTTDPAHPDVNAFFACKVGGLVWAAKAIRTGSTPADFAQSTRWGQMPTGSEAFNQVAACPAGFSPSRPIYFFSNRIKVGAIMSQPSYVELGVSAAKPDVHAAIANQDPGIFPGAFCKIVEDALTGDPDYCLAMHADGAGTKSTVAYLRYKERGDPSVFRGIAQDSLAMNTDDLLCVGAVDRLVVSNTVGRNAHRFGANALRHLIEGYADFRERMAGYNTTYNINVVLAGGETADVGDLVGTVIADSTVIARLKRSEVIDCSNIKPGNVIVGLASFGLAEYETLPNSGIGSNGFTLARHALLSSVYAQEYPETYSSTLRPEQVYTGPYKLDDKLPDSSQTVGEALLSPTRTYLPIVKGLLEQHGESVTGLIHSSGGGQVKCQKFGQGLHYIKDNLFPAPPIFRAIQEAGNVPLSEMYQTFNMGQRLEVYCEPASAEEIIAVSQGYGVEARVIGRVEESQAESNKVTIRDGSGVYTY